MNLTACDHEQEIEVLETALPAGQLVQPLDFIFADHFRQRVLCSVLDEIASCTRPDRALVRAAIMFLKSEFAPHVQDEEEDLFPLLQRRSKPDDHVDQLIEQLRQEHGADKHDAADIIKGLQELLDTAKKMHAGLARLLRRFSANEHHHLTLENAIILPLARLRLTHDDLCSLGRRMAQRRGLTYPEAPNAV